MKKEDILNNRNQYSAKELFGAIKNGVVTFEELNDSDEPLDARKRKALEGLLATGDKDQWQKAQEENTIEAVERYLEAYPSGEFRKKALELKESLEQAEEKLKYEQEQAKKAATLEAAAREAWAEVDKKDQDALEEFANEYPTSEYATKAQQMIEKMLEDEILGSGAERLVKTVRDIQANVNLNANQKVNNTVDAVKGFVAEGKEKKNEFLKELRQDHNLLNADAVKGLIEREIILLNDLTGIGINMAFLKIMKNSQVASKPPVCKPFDKIHTQSTEVYFWGIPSSGKSCALGAIMSVAYGGNVATMVQHTNSQGYGYMNQLVNMFKSNKVRYLPAGTGITDFWEMGFDLVEKNGNKHPITCIDMAGELMRCMYKKNDDPDSLTNAETDMLTTMQKVLVSNRSVNRKMHFFVIEYGAEDRMYGGLPQDTYLGGAMNYLQNTTIFKKDTDAIFVLITKADRAKDQSKDAIRKYIAEKYNGFYKNLEQICEDNGINGGKVEMMAFSLGEVCFQYYCKFDPRAAENVLRQILQRSAYSRDGKMGKILGKLKH